MTRGSIDVYSECPDLRHVAGRDMPYTIGIDFGTESARGVLVDIASGEQLGTHVEPYAHGVIDRALPDSDVRLPDEWALQDPTDWEAALEGILRALGGGRAEAIVGLGVDFTSCTVLPTHDLTPLCTLPAWRATPHAWPKLWKHHAAQPWADRINARGSDPEGAFLQWYGGRTSSEWLWAKAWQLLEEAPEVWEAADRFIEGGDWIVSRLVGREVRSRCQAGYKAHWQPDAGYPSTSFLASLDARLPSVLRRLGAPQPVGARAGGLTAEWAARAGLAEGTAVATAVIDAHASVPGLGVRAPGALVAILGTSTCHLLVSPERRAVPGISGVVRDGILPGLYAYEAGQAAVGDIFAWFVRTLGAGYGAEESTRYRRLEQAAARLAPGETGLVALDWWNGSRTPLVNAELSGALIGLTLSTEPHEIYRALLEAAAYGNRKVIETFEAGGVTIRQFHACGGLAERNPLLMQLIADVLDRPVLVSRIPHAAARGAAVYAAAAAGPSGGGYPDVGTAVGRMGQAAAETVVPHREAAQVYSRLYEKYEELHRYFGEGGSDVMVRLRRYRQKAAREQADATQDS